MATVSAAPQSDFGNQLALPAPAAAPVARVGWRLAGLFLLCLLPRAAEAWRIDALCKDGVFYLHLAEGFERGDTEAGLGRLRLNTYPLVLAALHRSGLDWETAAECWGLFISSLVVLPLFGWIRRQFDVRVATAACVLYAFHPKMIEWSPEAIRDPTFWFFWTGSLYCAWRAVVEIDWRWFLTAGLAIALALHTRFEGWFLYLPLIWWSGCRCHALAAQRWKIIAGAALAFGVCPALLLLVNLTWLRSQEHWELGNFGRLEYVVMWYQAATKHSLPPPQLAAPLQQAAAPTQLAHSPPVAASVERADLAMPRMKTAKTTLIYGNTLRRGIGGAFGILWFIGFITSPRLWLRRDHLVLFCVALCVAAGIWIHLWYAQATSSRYFLAIVLLASGCAAVGWVRASRWIYLAVSRLGGGKLAVGAAWAVALFAVAGSGVAQALINPYTSRQRDVALGQWLVKSYGLQPRVATSGSLELVDHYAGAMAAALPAERAAAAQIIADFQPVCLVLSRHVAPAGVADQLADAAGALGFRQVAAARLPAGFKWHDFIVMERSSGEQAAGAVRLQR